MIESAKKQSILHVIDTTGPGGAETVFLALAKACNDQGFRSLAVIRGPGWVEEKLKRQGIDYRIIDCKGSFNLRYLIKLVHLIVSERITLIQSHLLGSNVYACLAGLITRKPVIATFHGYVDIANNERLRTVKLKLIAMGARRIVGVTRELTDSIIKAGDASLGRKAVVVPNGIDVRTLSSVTVRDLPRDHQSALVFGSLGNIRVAKNYRLAIDFISAIQAQGIPARLIIAGDDTSKLGLEIKQYIAAKQLTETVTLLGFTDDVVGFFEKIDVFLLTSTTEGHPLALTQALAAGKPVLTTPNGVEHIMPTAFLQVSQAHSVGALRVELKNLLSDGARTEALEAAKRKRDYVHENYSQEAMTEAYFKLYGFSEALK